MLWIKSTAVAVTVFGGAGSALFQSARSPAHPRAEAVADTGSRAIDPTLAIATFDSAWRTIGLTLEGRGVTRLDWPAVRRELLPRAATAGSDSALRAVIDDMLGRIGESHFALLPAQVAPDERTPAGESSLGTAGIDLRVLNGRLVVWRADTTGAARRAGVRPGWTIERIGTFVPAALGPADTIGPRRLAVLTGGMRALRGAPGTRVALVARDAAGTR